MPQISMIVPVYQVERYIAQCIESVLQQTFRDFELILVDDGSRDASGRICDTYAARDGRITVIHTENRGAAAARNAGLDRARGSYITFLDGDDYLAETMLERLHAEIDSSAYDVVTSDFLNLLPDEKDNFILHLPEQTVTGRQVLEHLKNQRNYGVWTVVWNKIYRREVLETLRFPTGKFFEDEFFSDALFARAGQVRVIPDVLVYHRVLASSTMNTQKTENYLDLLDALQRRIEFYLQNGYSPDETFKVLVFLLDPFARCAGAGFGGENRRRVEQARRFIQKTAFLLRSKKLPLLKKTALLPIGVCPAWTYRTALRFRSVLEKFL